MFPGIGDRFSPGNKAEVTDYFNSPYWFSVRPGIVAALDSPVTGIGVGMHRLHCPAIPQGPHWLVGQNDCHPHPHQFYVQLAEETGLFGLLTGIIMIVSIIITAAAGRKHRTLYSSIAWIPPALLFSPSHQLISSVSGTICSCGLPSVWRWPWHRIEAAAAPRRCLVTARLAGTEHAALTSEIFINNRLHPLPAKTGKMASMNPADRHLSEPAQTFAELIRDGMIEMVIQCAVIKRIACEYDTTRRLPQGNGTRGMSRKMKHLKNPIAKIDNIAITNRASQGSGSITPIRHIETLIGQLPD